MASKRFFKLRAALHVADANTLLDPPKDKVWKVGPITEAVRSRCLALQPIAECSIEEQMVPFMGRVPIEQFVKNKPNHERIKVFVHCSSDSIVHDFEVYQRKDTGMGNDHSHLGLGGLVVMRLVEALPRGLNERCYTDNYFSSVQLFQELKLLGILVSGTFRAQKILGCELNAHHECFLPCHVSG